MMNLSDQNTLAMEEYKKLGSTSYVEPTNGSFPDATNEILEQLKSPSDDEDMNFEESSTDTENEDC